MMTLMIKCIIIVVIQYLTGHGIPEWRISGVLDWQGWHGMESQRE